MESNKTIKERVPYILRLVGLGSKIKNKPSQLSGGEQQRVSLARALVNNPEIIIADEPTGNVDPEMSHEIIDLLSEINKQGTTIIVVTHEHELVKEFGKRVIEIHKGKIVHDTKLEETSADELELISSYDQDISDDELSPLLKLDEESPEDVEELHTQKEEPVEVEEVEEEEAPRSQVEQVVENIDKIVEEIESDNKEDLIHTVTLDPAKIRRIIAEDEKKKKQDAAVDSVIDSLK